MIYGAVYGTTFGDVSTALGDGIIRAVQLQSSSVLPGASFIHGRLLNPVSLQSEMVIPDTGFYLRQIVPAVSLESTLVIDSAGFGFSVVTDPVSLESKSQLMPASFKINHITNPVTLESSLEITGASFVHGRITNPVSLESSLELIGAGFEHGRVLNPVTLESSSILFTGLDIYLGVTYSTENRSITTYSNFNFDGGCVFNGKTLLFNESGIFECGGNTDNGTAIVPSLKTGFMDMVSGQNGFISTHKMKRIPTSRVLVMANKTLGSMTLNVTPDTNTYSYANAVQQTGFATFNIDIGRGIKYNKLQLELVANGCSSLDIESVSYEPTEIVRSQR